MTGDDRRAIERVQRGVLTVTQATERFGRTALRRRLAAGRWVCAGRRVIVLHNGPLSDEQRLWLALLSAPRGSVLGSWSALVFDALTAEVHGAHHTQVQQLEHDWRRHNDLTVEAGRRVLHFTAHEVRTRPDAVASVLRQAMFGDNPADDLPTLS
jgi:hypothetical protein